MDTDYEPLRSGYPEESKEAIELTPKPPVKNIQPVLIKPKISLQQVSKV